MHVAACSRTNHKANRTSSAQGRDAHAALHAGLQSLRRNLSTTEHHEGIDRLKRNTLAAVWSRDQQRAAPTPYMSAMIPDVEGIQIAHSNTAPVI